MCVCVCVRSCVRACVRACVRVCKIIVICRQLNKGHVRYIYIYIYMQEMQRAKISGLARLVVTPSKGFGASWRRERDRNLAAVYNNYTCRQSVCPTTSLASFADLFVVISPSSLISDHFNSIHFISKSERSKRRQ